MTNKKISSTKPKMTKIDLEAKKLSYKHKEAILKANLQFEALKNQQINEQENIYLKQQESSRKKILDGYKHEEEMMRLEVENNKIKATALEHCFEMYLKMVVEILPTLEDRRSENMKLLMEYNNDVTTAYDKDIEIINENIKKLQMELDGADKYSVNSFNIQDNIDNLEQTKKQLLFEKLNFLNESTAKLDNYMNKELEIPNPFNFKSLGSTMELVGNSDILLINGDK